LGSPEIIAEKALNFGNRYIYCSSRIGPLETSPQKHYSKNIGQWKHLKKLQQTFGPRGTTESGSVKTFVQRESLKLLSKNQPYL
jgi:hypothetical protein